MNPKNFFPSLLGATAAGLAVGFFIGQNMGSSHVTSNNMTSTEHILGEINGQTVTHDSLKGPAKSRLYTAQENYYNDVSQILHETYLDLFFEEQAKRNNVSVEEAKAQYFAPFQEVDPKQVDELLERFKDHPQLQKFSEAEKREQIRAYLGENQKAFQMQNLIADAKRSGSIKVGIPKPLPPKMDIKLTDVTDYGNSKAPVTVTVFVDLQCPMCKAAHEQFAPVISQYKNQVRWVIKAFPLSFHPEAKPAAIALRCIYDISLKEKPDQISDIFEKAYESFYEYQKELSVNTYERIASSMGIQVDTFRECYKDPQIAAKVEAEMNEGMDLGVAGTPTFYVNGEKINNSAEQLKERIEHYLLGDKR